MPLCEKSKNGIVYVALYIDDNLMTGNVEDIDDDITALKEKWLVKIVEVIQNCPVKLNSQWIKRGLG